MALTNTDLLLVQRGNTPMKAEATVISNFVKGEVDATDIEIASASQLGVVRIGKNLTIDPSGVLDAVIPAGVEFQGIWTDANNPPTQGNNGDPLANGMFWVWDAGAATLNNALWGNANGESIDDGDRIFYDGTTFDVVPGGGGGITAVKGVAPIVIDNTDPTEPEVTITNATDTADGAMSASDKAKLDTITAGAEPNVAQNLSYDAAANDGHVRIDGGGTDATIPVATQSIAGLMSANDKGILDNLVASPGGVLSVVAGDGIDVDSSNAGAPVVSVEFGSTPNGTPVTVMPYDISMLAEIT